MKNQTSIGKAIIPALVAICSLIYINVNAQTLAYNFDESGCSAVNSGSSGVQYNLLLLNASDVESDLHGEGMTGGKALNLTTATGMGSLGGASGPVAVNQKAGDVFGGAKSFTISGWYFVSAAPTASARFLQTKNLTLMFNGNLILQLANDHVASNAKIGGIITQATGITPDYSVAGQWVFMAVTYAYNPETNLSTATFYSGDIDPKSELAARTIVFTAESPILNKGGRLMIGNTQGNVRPFKGLIDNLCIYTATDSAGALDSTTLNALRLAQISGK